ncbi:MAG: hypothetical protein GQ570_01395 [Helicobacteraceae bacterium]|nr:hypothetical protein [Helicobacteraceae bacterium]
MQSKKLKLILTVLSAFVFSMFFILLAFVIPIAEEAPPMVFKKEKKFSQKNRLEHIAGGFKKNK